MRVESGLAGSRMSGLCIDLWFRYAIVRSVCVLRTRDCGLKSNFSLYAIRTPFKRRVNTGRFFRYYTQENANISKTVH